MISTKEAIEFFAQWREWSKLVLQGWGIPTNCGDRRRKWNLGHPVGEMKHFTAGTGFIGSCRWGNSKHNDRCSYPIVMGDRILDLALPPVPDLVKKYLPVTGVMLSDLDKGHWHGNWTNGFTVGVENRNCGPLRLKGGKFYWWAKEFKVDQMGKDPVNIDGKWYEPFTAEQLVANIWLTRLLVAAYAEEEHPFDARWIIPHSAVAWGKVDTGRAFPMNLVRASAMLGTYYDRDPWDVPWIKQYKAAPDIALGALEEEEESSFVDAMIARDIDYRDEDDDEEPELDDDMSTLIEGGKWRDPKHLKKVLLGLHELGYHITHDPGTDFSDESKTAVWMFQKCATRKRCGNPDKIPGPKTRRALYKRLKQFQLED